MTSSRDAARPAAEFEIGDDPSSKNIGASSAASSTLFNGFPPAKMVHCNR